MQIEELCAHYAGIIRGLGEDPDREGLTKTPERAARAMAYLCRGYAYLWSGEYESAVADLTRAIELDMEDADIYAYRAWAYSLLGDTAAAIADYESALTLNPEDADSHNNAAYLIAQSDGDLDKALEYVNRALELMPGAESKLDTKGYILYKMEEYDEALEILTPLIADGYAFGYYSRGLVYQALGEAENAISDFEAFLQEYPDRDPESDDARERIKSLQD